MGDQPSIAQKPYTLLPKHTQAVKEEVVMLEKSAVITYSVLTWLIPTVLVPKKPQTYEVPQKQLCMNYSALDNLLTLVVKANSKDQGVLSLVLFPKIYKLHAML